MRLPARIGVRRIVCAALSALAGCTGGVLYVPEGPLGWPGPIEARQERKWSARSLDEAPVWEMVEPPAFVVVPDSVRRAGWTPSQRYVHQALVMAGGRVVLLTDPNSPDSILLRIFDPAGGEDTRVRAPGGTAGEQIVWSDLTMAAHDDGVVVLGSIENGAPRPGRPEGVWFANADGVFRRPASRVAPVGPLLGVLSDGSLVTVEGRTATNDTTLIDSTLLITPVPAHEALSGAEAPQLVFETAVRRDPTADYPVHFFWAHDPRWATGVAGDTIWTIPTERPELVGVHRSGEVVLKVEWEAGDRTIPADASDEVREALRGLERFPAARRLFVGTSGLVHVQRVVWRGGRPHIGPEWLVFSPAGELVARLDIPPRLDVMAFGPGSLVAKARNEAGVVEIRVYMLKKPNA